MGMETRGIFLMIWGKPQYGHMAYQLAMSLKFYSPSLPIHLCTDQIAVSRLHYLNFFDTIEYIDTPVDPAQAKIDMYDRLPFDHNIFLDADGLAEGDMDSVFDELAQDERPFRCFVHAYYGKEDANDFPLMVWARRDVIWSHYGFEDHTMPACQSSLLYIRKSSQAKQIYDSMRLNYANRIPLDKLKNKWGGGQPDELYLNITLAQMGYDPGFKNIIYFADDRTLSPHQIKASYKILSLFGTSNNVKPVFERHYDQSVKNLANHFGVSQTFLWKNIKSAKHANTRVMVNKRQAFKGGFIRSEKLPHEPIVKTGRVLLFTSYFDTGHAGRQRELNTCLNENIQNKNIDQIYVVHESGEMPQSSKVTTRNGSRPSYRELVDWANEVSQPEDVVVIANSDIYFDDTILWPFKAVMSRTMIALSRWDMMPTGHRRLFAYEHSQDTWMFKGKINIDGGDYYFGLPGCDNRFAYDANQSGYRVVNPAKDIITYHVHNTNHRHYTQSDRLEGGYLPVFITSIRDLQANKILIKQPGKVGDIVSCLPIAKHYADLGHTVEWECPVQYHPLFNYVDYVKPVSTGGKDYSKIIDMSFGLNPQSATNIAWKRRRGNGTLDSFLTLKYELAGVDISELRNLKYNRNEHLENALFDILGLHVGDDYVLVHSNSDYGDPITVDTTKHVVEFAPVEGYAIFDWRKVIENASEIHCIDSSLVNFVDAIQTDAKLYYYITNRVPMKADRAKLVKG